MTNRELLNKCNDKAFVKFLLRQRGCLLCVARNTCPHNPGGARNRLYLHLTRKGLAQYINSAAKGYGSRKCQVRLEQAFNAWNDTQVTCYDPNIVIEAQNDEVEPQNDEMDEPAKNVTEDAPEPSKNVAGKSDLHNIALLLQSLAGTGAKLTIEVTL